VIVVGAAGLLVLARRAPVEEARRFLRAPIELGERPPPAPAEPASPAEIERRYAGASAAFAAGEYGEAATGFAWIASHDPGGPRAGSAQWNLTRSRLRSGDGMGALDAFDGLLRHHADYLAAEAPLLRQGLEHMERGELARAAALFEEMIREQPQSELVPVAHALLARVHWIHGEPMAMVGAFARLFASVRDPVPGYATLARELERYASGEPGVADTFQRLADEGEDGFRDIYQYLAARSLLEQERFEATRSALEELRRRHPRGDFTHIVDLEHAWNLLRHGQPAEALAIFRRLEHAPVPPEAAAFDAFFDLRAELPMGIARCYLALGDFTEAAAAFERALAEHPLGIYDVENRVSLAVAYERGGRLDDAARTLQAVIAAHPEEPKLWAVRQQLARIEGQRSRAGGGGSDTEGGTAASRAAD
jgi:outer membrane protein assembly factor BamD (BamD/ComL family)